MKKIFPLSLLFLAASFYAQNISDYQYIQVTTKDFANNKYGLTNMLEAQLKQKNYTVISEDLVPGSVAVRDKCDLLTAEIVDTSNMFRNRLELNFKDCNNKIIASVEGKSMEKDFEPGMRDALAKASNEISASNPTVKSEPVKAEIAVIKTEEKVPVETPTPVAAKEIPLQKIENVAIKKTNSAEVYSNGTISLNKIFLSESQFILVSPNTSTPYAIFKASTKKDVYHVQLQDGTSTLGYLEDGKIVVDQPTAEGNFRKENFTKK